MASFTETAESAARDLPLFGVHCNEFDAAPVQKAI